MSLTIIYGVKGLHEDAVYPTVHGLRIRMRHWDAHEGRDYLPPKVLVHQARAGQLGGEACGGRVKAQWCLHCVPADGMPVEPLSASRRSKDRECFAPVKAHYFGRYFGLHSTP